jgi:L-fuculose-phosphate aldolase
MKLDNLHPREQIAEIMHRVYSFGMTTTSGGNISIRDDEGGLWITPSAVDKGALRPDDVVYVAPDDTVYGLHKPSSELPFHRAIYHARPDVGSVLHGHPPGLVAFSIVRQVPDTRVIPQVRHVCGPVGYAPYELPGSAELGRGIASIFANGVNAVIMENHGTVMAGSSLSDTFQRFETLESCARTILDASSLGDVHRLSEEQLARFGEQKNVFPEFAPSGASAKERELRSELRRMVRRAYEQQLIISTYGTFSCRVHDDAFLITPYGIDRYYVEREDLVLIDGGYREVGKTPSRSAQLHDRIYKDHPQINSIISAQSPHAAAHAVAGKTLDTRTIPESYVLLRDIPLVPYGDQFGEGVEISRTLSPETPILMLANDSILVTGSSLAETFDRLEVCEFSARSLIESRSIGEMVPMSDSDIQRLNEAFFGATKGERDAD